MTTFIVPVVESKYAEGRRLGHLYNDCPAVKRAEARGGVEHVGRLDGRGLCGVCTRRRLAEQRPEPVAVNDFYLAGDSGGEGAWLHCPDEQCTWRTYIAFRDTMRDLAEVARKHMRSAHEG